MVSLCFAPLLFACVEDSSATEADEADAAEQGTGDSEAVEWIPARGISIDEVEINQGTRVPIGVGAEWIDGPERKAYLIASRDSLLRIHYTVDDATWVPREIEARVTLEFPDGTSTTLKETLLIEESSRRYWPEGGFWFGLIGASGHTLAGIKYRIELWEAEDGIGDDLPEQIWANPASGPELVGFESTPLEMKVVFVPIHYVPLDTTPDLNETTVQPLADNLYEQNPATAVIWDIHPPVDYDSTLNNLGSLLPVAAQLKSDEAAPPNVYYHALVDINAPSLGGVLGIGSIVSANKAEGNLRVAATVYWPGNPKLAADTFTHEVGHNQGLAHVACPNGDAAGPDPTYPHENGRIGDWGFGIRRFLMYDPDDAFDYMTYCGPSWVSDWTWNKTYQRIRALTAWDYEGAPADPEPPGTLLIASFYPDGSTQWWTVPGALDPQQASGDHRLRFATEQGDVVERLAEVRVLSDGASHWVMSELPVELDRVTAIEHLSSQGSVVVSASEVVDHRTVGSDWTPTLRSK